MLGSFAAARLRDMAKTIGLYLIALNEAETLPRMLASVEGAFDEIVLVDTGSTDNTVEVFNEWAESLPFDERPVCKVRSFQWCDDFSAARNYALDQVESYWAVRMDADDTMESTPRELRKALNQPENVVGVMMPYEWHSGFSGHLCRATRTGHAGWAGRLHESLVLDGARATYDRCLWKTHRVAGTRDSEKDLAMLRADIADDPANARAQFYLAQTYKDAGQPVDAIREYDKRVAMGGWAEETWWSMYQSGVQCEMVDEGEAVRRLLAAYNFRPSRAEPLYELGNYYRRKEQPATALLFLDQAANIPTPENDVLFVQNAVYDWGIAFERGICCFWTGQLAMSTLYSAEVVDCETAPENVREQAALNYGFAIDALDE